MGHVQLQLRRGDQVAVREKSVRLFFISLFFTIHTHTFLNEFYTISLHIDVYMDIHKLTPQQCPLGIHQTDGEIGSKRSLQKIENDIR